MTRACARGVARGHQAEHLQSQFGRSWNELVGLQVVRQANVGRRRSRPGCAPKVRDLWLRCHIIGDLDGQALHERSGGFAIDQAISLIMLGDPAQRADESIETWPTR